MKMISKYINKVRIFLGVITISLMFSLMVAPVNADVSVKNIEKNDKVEGSELASDRLLGDYALAGERAGWVLKAEQWELTRTGESLLSLPVLKAVINAWFKDRQQRIEIQYPGGEEGEFWVQELTDWLVSLGIPSHQMVIVPGSGAGDMIKFNLRKL